MSPDERSGTPESPTLQTGTGHAVQFYETDEFLADVIARYAAEALAAGEPAVLIMSREHADRVRPRLEELGVGVEEATTGGRLFIREAETLLPGLMAGPLIDEAACRASLEALLDEAMADRIPGTSVRVFGEMVDLLWRGGNTVAALKLEDIWNELLTRYPMGLVCAYSMSHFRRAEHDRAFRSICDHHTHVLPAEGYGSLGVDERDLEVNLLRQRAQALEAELARRAGLEKALREALAARRRTEEELRAAKDEAERTSRTKSDFLAVMSHELRTPLNAIFGYEDLLRHQASGTLSETQLQYLDRMRASAQQLLGLVNQVLQLSRIEAGREELLVERVVPAQLASEALQSIEPAAAKKGLTLQLQDETGGLELETDGGKLRQILLNLLSNAVKFTEGGGITVAVRVETGALIVDVADTGPGIREDQLERIFEPFVQADYSMTLRFGGTGLGLSVSRHLAGLLGGSLDVRSTPEGSTFTLRIPCVH